MCVCVYRNAKHVAKVVVPSDASKIGASSFLVFRHASNGLNQDFAGKVSSRKPCQVCSIAFLLDLVN